MFNYSGLWFRIWGSYSFLLALGIICILIGKPWVKPFKFRRVVLGLAMILVAVIFSTVLLTRIWFGSVSSYTGEYVESYRSPREAPPIPVTYNYVFWNGEGLKPVFSLDSFSKKKIFSKELITGETYTVYYDNLTNIILRIEHLEE